MRSGVSELVLNSGQPGFCSNEPTARTSKRGPALIAISDPIGSRPSAAGGFTRSNQSRIRGPLVP